MNNNKIRIWEVILFKDNAFTIEFGSYENIASPKELADKYITEWCIDRVIVLDANVNAEYKFLYDSKFGGE